MTNRTIITATLTLAATFAVAAPAQADDTGCYIGDYQGVPLEICPQPEPDPANCYTGDYQGAPIEICLPTGERLPEGSTMADGSPVVYHTSVTYTPPTDVYPVTHAVDSAETGHRVSAATVDTTEAATSRGAAGPSRGLHPHFPVQVR